MRKRGTGRGRGMRKGSYRARARARARARSRGRGRGKGRERTMSTRPHLWMPITHYHYMSCHHQGGWEVFRGAPAKGCIEGV